MLSSAREAAVYLSSAPGVEGVEYAAGKLRLEGLALDDGSYEIEVWRPAAPGGTVGKTVSAAAGGALEVGAPAFVDDLALHIGRGKKE